MPGVEVAVGVVDVVEEDAAAAEGCAGSPGSLDDAFGEDVDLGWEPAALGFVGGGGLFAGLGEVAAGAAVEADEADEVAVEVAEREAAGAGDVAAFDLDPADALLVDVAGEEVVAGEVGVGLPGGDPLGEQGAEDEEFGAFGFEAGVPASGRRCRSSSHGPRLARLRGFVCGGFVCGSGRWRPWTRAASCPEPARTA